MSTRARMRHLDQLPGAFNQFPIEQRAPRRADGAAMPESRMFAREEMAEYDGDMSGSTRGSRVGFGGSPKQSSDQNSIQTGAIDFVKGRAEPVATPNASRPQ